MKNEFAVVNFLEECHWDSNNLNNYNLINYAHDDLKNEEKLLTHWMRNTPLKNEKCTPLIEGNVGRMKL